MSDFTTNPYGGSAASYSTVLTIGAIAVFFPVLLLISIVTGLGAAQRRERFATLRLIGASPQVLARIAAAETAVPSLAGAVVGVVLAAVLRPAAAQIPVNGTRMFAADLTTGWVAATAVVVVVVAASALVAGHRTARAGIGPLGVTRTVHEETPTMWRTVPLIAGLTAMIAAVLLIRVLEVQSPWLELPLLIGGFLLVLVGIVVIGPWLTLLVSRIGLRQARSAAGVIAASRIQRTPVATFRSVSGLVIAVFVVSVFAGASSITQPAEAPLVGPGLLQPTSLHATVGTGLAPAQVAEVTRQARDLPGIRSATVGYGPAALAEEDAGPDIYLRAADADVLGFEDIPASEVVAVDASFLYFWATQPLELAPAPAQIMDGLVPVVIVLGTDGTPEAMDRARTVLNASGVTAFPATSPMDGKLQSSIRLIRGLAVLAYLGMAVAVAIAGLSLAVATASAVLDRKRVLGLMRLMGMPTCVLRRTTRRNAWPMANRFDQRVSLLIVEQERTRIARDLHDVLAHSLAVIAAQADGTRYLSKDQPKAVLNALDTIARSARSALVDAQRVIEGVRDDGMVTPQPQLNDIPALIEGMQRGGLKIHPRESGTHEELSTGQEVAVIRIVQECLTNALKHGGRGTDVRLHFDWSGPGLTLHVASAVAPAGKEDAAIPAAPRVGRGLPGMRERAHLAGGWLTAGPDGEHFRVTVFIPYGTREARAADDTAGIDAGGPVGDVAGAEVQPALAAAGLQVAGATRDSGDRV